MDAVYLRGINDHFYLCSTGRRHENVREERSEEVRFSLLIISKLCCYFLFFVSLFSSFDSLPSLLQNTAMIIIFLIDLFIPDLLNTPLLLLLYFSSSHVPPPHFLFFLFF